MGGLKLKKRRKKLFEKQNGLCHYCKCKMIHMFDVPQTMTKPYNLCTIEHLRDRFDPTRQEPNCTNEQRQVAACNKCNHKRNKQREKEQGIEELRRRAKNGEDRRRGDKLHINSDNVHLSPGRNEPFLCSEIISLLHRLNK